MARVERKRLDELLVERGLAVSRSAARGLILAGLVEVNGLVKDKAGALVPMESQVTLKARPRYVSRGGDKLASALAAFDVDVSGAWALDVGASTGGFTDCLLQHGAERVIALDVGRGQLDLKIRNDPRVHVIEGLNARYLRPEQLPYRPNFLTMDVSFISVTKLLPAVTECMQLSFAGLVLVKPQFEAGPHLVGKGGIVRDPDTHREVLLSVLRFSIGIPGISVMGVCRSGLAGAEGNIEYFVYMARGRGEGLTLDSLEDVVDRVVASTDYNDKAKKTP
ncbi:MAG: TlyA family RNA methyltransferase [Thermoleophilia bacterium]|nr:TlyA family RNA methyltransferase [Thermoleophilia bacterium]